MSSTVYYGLGIFKGELPTFDDRRGNHWTTACCVSPIVLVLSRPNCKVAVSQIIARTRTRSSSAVFMGSATRFSGVTTAAACDSATKRRTASAKSEVRACMVTAGYNVELGGCVCSYKSTRVEAYASYSLRLYRGTHCPSRRSHVRAADNLAAQSQHHGFSFAAPDACQWRRYVGAPTLVRTSVLL